MAGRGRGAVLPAWMKPGGSAAGPVAPGAGPTPSLPAPSSSSVPGASTLPSSTVPSTSAWTEHTAPDGRKYYYNRLLSKSSWEKPEELKTPAERSATAGTVWKEYTAPDGRKYYYNPVTKQSSWTPPPGHIAGAAAPAAPPSSASATASQVVRLGSSLEGGRPSSSLAIKGHSIPLGAIQPGPTPHYATTAEAKEAFRSLLNDAAIPATFTWEDVVMALAMDRRFGALKTVGERKAAFNEYIQHKRKEEAEAARQERLKAKEAFFELLNECKQLVSEASPPPEYRTARELLSGDPRWARACPTDADGETLFSEWLEDRAHEERERRRAEKLRLREEFGALLAGAPWITAHTSWREAQDRLGDTPVFRALDRVSRLEVWEARMTELEAQDRERQEKARNERKRRERENRDAFRRVLAQHRSEGTIHARSRWKEFYPLVADDVALRAVEENLSGSRPKELFMDVVEELEEETAEAMEAFEKAVGAIRVVENITRQGIDQYESVDQFWEAFLNEVESERQEDAQPAASILKSGTLSKASARTAVWLELKARAARAARKADDDFKSMLRRLSLGPDATYEQAVELCSSTPEWGAITGRDPDQRRRALLHDFLVSRTEEQARALGKAREEEAGGPGDGKKVHREGHSRSERDGRHGLRRKNKRHRSRDRSRGVSDGSSDSGEDSGDRRRGRRYKRKRHGKEKSGGRRRSRSRDRREERYSDGEVEEGEVR